MEVVKAEIEPGYRRHLVLSGEVITPRVAHARALIGQIVPPEHLVERAVELARTRAAALSFGRVKREIVTTCSDPMLEHWV